MFRKRQYLWHSVVIDSVNLILKKQTLILVTTNEISENQWNYRYRRMGEGKTNSSPRQRHND